MPLTEKERHDNHYFRYNIEMDIKKDRIVTSASFDEIKSKLDPEFGYLILRSNSEALEDIHFGEIENRIACFRQGIIEETTYYDEATGEAFLTIKLSADVRDGCIQEFSTLNLPKGVTIYIFSNSQLSKNLGQRSDVR
jgi:hypothetical protein